MWSNFQQFLYYDIPRFILVPQIIVMWLLKLKYLLINILTLNPLWAFYMLTQITTMLDLEEVLMTLSLEESTILLKVIEILVFLIRSRIPNILKSNIIGINNINILDIFLNCIEIGGWCNFVGNNHKASMISSNKVSHNIWLDVFEHLVNINNMFVRQYHNSVWVLLQFI